MWNVALYILRRPWLYTCLLALWATYGYTAVSVNVPLDDPAYPLLEKLVSSNLTFRNALTIKPITRVYAAQLIAEAIGSGVRNGKPRNVRTYFWIRPYSTLPSASSANCGRLVSLISPGR